MRRSTQNQRTLEEILDSDDEFPSDFTEEYYVPAYQDDNRFKYFEDLKSKAKESLKEEQPIIPSHEKNITKAIISKKDVFCFQCLEKHTEKTPNDTLLWFFNFLIYKDLQSQYSFLKSCLVPRYKDYYSKHNYESKYKSYENYDENKVRYKLVINKL